jgi:hypothetical protein
MGKWSGSKATALIIDSAVSSFYEAPVAGAQAFPNKAARQFLAEPAQNFWRDNIRYCDATLTALHPQISNIGETVHIAVRSGLLASLPLWHRAKRKKIMRHG